MRYKILRGQSCNLQTHSSFTLVLSHDHKHIVGSNHASQTVSLRCGCVISDAKSSVTAYKLTIFDRASTNWA